MAIRGRYASSRGKPALAAVPGSRSRAAHGAQRGMPGAAGHACRRTESPASLPPLLATLRDQWAAMSAHAVRRLAAAPFTLFDAGLGPGAALARAARTRGPRPGGSRRTRLFRGCCGALDHAPHAGLRLAPGAQPAARGMPGVRLDSPAVESLAACSLAALEAAADRNADALRPRWAQQFGFWRELLAASSVGADTRLSELLLGGIQRLAAETLAAHAP